MSQNPEKSVRILAIEAALQSLQPSILRIRDDSHLHAGHAGARDGRGHFAVEIASPQFVGLGLLAKHRLVYAAVGTLMQTDIQALQIHCL